MNKMTLAITISIMFGFALIMWATDAVSASFGKVGENIALGIVAIVLIIGLVKAKKEKSDEERTENKKK
jgi:archaellum biogenesis protein FlaJ (TadC family)